MSETVDNSKLWCLLLSAVIVSFVVGYTTGFFVFRQKISTVAPHKSTFAAPVQYKPVLQPGPGSERFYNAVDSEKSEPEDHDSQIINRMKK